MARVPGPTPTTIIRCVPYHQTRMVDICNWETENGTLVFQERTHWGRAKSPAPGRPSTPAQIFHGVFTTPNTHYWVFETYLQLNEAEADAQRFHFVATLEPYSSEEQPAWFPVFNNFDKVIQYLHEKRGIHYVSPEQTTTDA